MTASLPAAWLALRMTAFLTGGFGLVALTTVDGAPIGVPLSGLAALAAGGYTSAHAGTPAWDRMSQVMSTGLLAVFGAAGGYLTYAGQQPVSVLRMFSVGVLLAHSFAQKTRRDVLVGVTISVFMAVLPVGTSANPRLGVLLVLSWIGALAALVIAQHIGQWETDAVIAVPHRPAAVAAVRPASAMALAVAAAMILGFLVFLALPRPDGAAARRNLVGGQRAPFGSGGGQGRGVGSYSGAALDMRVRGTLPTQPVLDVPQDSPELWRGTVYDTYDGTIWLPVTDGLRLISDRTGYAVPPDPEAAALQPRAQRVDTVRVHGPFNRLPVVAPGQLSRLETSGRVGNGPSGPLLVDGARDIEYVVTSTSALADPADLSAAHGADPTEGRWTALPAIPSRVAGLAATLASPTGNRLETVRAVERELQARARYRLDSPVPPAGWDSVDHFLFESQLGFCEHFAAAEVVLLRSLGIPARLVTGFAYGEPTGDGYRLMRGANLHAWTEVWFPEVGWVSFDPTREAAQAASSSPGALADLSALVRRTLATGRGRLLVAIAVLVVTAAAWGGWRLRRRRQVRRTPHRELFGQGGRYGDAGVRRQLWAALQRVVVALDETGRGSPPAETLNELAGRLGLRPDEARAFAVLERACYSSAAPAPADEQAAVTALDGLASRLLAAAAATTAVR